MAVSISIQVQVPLTVVDSTGTSTALHVAVAPGRVAGEVAVTFTSAQLTQIGTDGGLVYLTGADFQSAVALLQQAQAITATPTS